MFTQLEIILFVILGVSVLIGGIWIHNTEKRLKRFFLGKKGKDLEDSIVFLQEEIGNLQEAKSKIEKDLSVLYNKAEKSIRGLEIIRFNPFTDQGSNQSFAIGMLNEKNDGVVISSLYSRDRMSVFAKPIKNGQSEYELSTEEKEVIEKAKVS